MPFLALSRPRSAHRLAVMLAVASLWLGIALPIASSAPPAERHCVVEVIGQHSSGELITAEEVCFSSFSEAMQHASGGAIELGADAEGGVAFTDAGVSASLSTFTLGIHYDGYNGTGSSITVVGSSCTGGWWNTPSWFDNRTSSSYNGCYRLRHYDLPNKGGSSYSTYGVGQTDNLTAFNNRTESVQYLSS